MDRQTLSIKKACEVVGVSRRTIYSWISTGKAEYVRTAGGSIRIFADSLRRDAAPERRRQRYAHGGRTDRVHRPSPANHPGAGPSQPATADLPMLIHRLNNQLGILLAHVERLEAQAADERAKARAAQVVSSILNAIGTAREIRRTMEPSER